MNITSKTQAYCWLDYLTQQRPCLVEPIIRLVWGYCCHDLALEKWNPLWTTYLPCGILEITFHTTAHLSEWPKSKSTTPPNADTKTQNHCWWECKMVQLLWKTVWQFLTKLNTLLPWDLTVMLLGISQRSWKLCLRKNLQRDVCTRFIHNCQNLTATKISFSRWMDKCLYPDGGIIFRAKKWMRHQAMKRLGGGLTWWSSG